MMYNQVSVQSEAVAHRSVCTTWHTILAPAVHMLSSLLVGLHLAKCCFVGL